MVAEVKCPICLVDIGGPFPMCADCSASFVRADAKDGSIGPLVVWAAKRARACAEHPAHCMKLHDRGMQCDFTRGHDGFCMVRTDGHGNVDPRGGFLTRASRVRKRKRS